ncbi:type 1 glutamine amidotransferase [Conexibacter sp. JD483]|uniref:type 1 glutamine amidotransferase n=1 Tax=unclassified Conexibacter TaxID=2627773 RepID=UPI002727821A|nr:MULTISPECIES: type 1 glutamine amidotransferase [unclassified Conexibacter]MDO8188953.1 type 1 glutamine amidotransferase [Conexibacter sp. CPCC 205706]MDO8201732.1 type 1 glutamine amidotransferase [Conexibacter sp. CPCC 205762]MDR9371415.1 type 1 glutamine amidotransferase [Conexibacter sp. JD483]
MTETVSPRPLLVVRHVPWEGPHRILDPFGDAPVRVHDRFGDAADAPLPPLDEVCGAVFMGGPMSVNDPLPWIAEEVAWLRAALAAETPVLGVCLGSQLLAVAAGGRVVPGAAQEIGVAPVELLGDAANDPLLGALAPAATVLHWHGELIELPAGIAPLARSAQTAVQAFRAGPRAWGTLFHAEADAALIDLWLAEPSMAAEARAHLGDDSAARLRADAAALDSARGQAAFAAFARVVRAG